MQQVQVGKSFPDTFSDIIDLLSFRLSTGACVELQGRLTDSPGKEQQKELQVDSVKVLGECDSVSGQRRMYVR
jgi:aspartyl/asparaginyl-tRNA synthetase